MTEANGNVIVYADDEQALCELFELNFEHLGHEIKTFLDPEEALSYINENSTVKVFFCDFRFPKTRGTDVIKKVRDSVPCYLVTGDLNVDTNEIPQIKQLIHKPIDEDMVEKIIEGHTKA